MYRCNLPSCKEKISGLVPYIRYQDLFFCCDAHARQWLETVDMAFDWDAAKKRQAELYAKEKRHEV